MRYLCDTHLAIWSALSPAKLSSKTKAILKTKENEVYFSTVTVWEVAIKFGLGRKDFTLPPATLRRALLAMGYKELSITSEQAIAVSALPPHHRDPFDRLLTAQAMTEGLTLLTADKTLSRYPNTLRV